MDNETKIEILQKHGYVIWRNEIDVFCCKEADGERYAGCWRDLAMTGIMFMKEHPLFDMAELVEEAGK